MLATYANRLLSKAALDKTCVTSHVYVMHPTPPFLWISIQAAPSAYVFRSSNRRATSDKLGATPPNLSLHPGRMRRATTEGLIRFLFIKGLDREITAKKRIYSP